MCKQLDLSPDAPWKQRFQIAEIWAAKIAAADRERGLIWSNQSGTMQLYAWEIPTNQLRQLTNKPTDVWKGAIAANGQYIYYLDDQQGNELGHYVRVPFTGGEPEDLTPDLPPFFAIGISDGSDSTTLKLQIRIEKDEQTYLINQDSAGKLSQPRPTKVINSRYSHFSNTAEIAVFHTYHQKTGSYQLVVMEVTSQEIVATLSIPETDLFPIHLWDQSGSLTVLVKSVKWDTTRLFFWDVRRNHLRYLPVISHQGELAIRSYEDYLLLRHTHRAKDRLYTFNLATLALTRLNHANGSVFTAEFMNEQEILATLSDATHPSRLVVLSTSTGQILRTLSPSEYSPPSRPWTEVVFPTTNGLEIQAWLALPLGNPPFPTILQVHGGPASTTKEHFDPNCQAWLDHGFAWMSINYRGSTSFGKGFEHVIHGQPGQLEVEDMVAARDWLVKQGIANPATILVTGASHGGYLTLQALSTAPDLWAGGMAEVAFADWSLMYSDPNNITSNSVAWYLGGTPEEKPEAYKLASPLTYAEHIRVPLLIIQGKYDSRCTPHQIRVYERKLMSLGKDIQIHWFDGGHFREDVALRIQHQEVMLRFAYRAVHGSSEIFAQASHEQNTANAQTHRSPRLKRVSWKAILSRRWAT